MLYEVKEIDENNRAIWDKVPCLYINDYSWDENRYKFKALIILNLYSILPIFFYSSTIYSAYL